MPGIVPSQVRLFIASIPAIVLLAPLSPALAQQKPALPSPNSQAQLAEHVKELERRLNDAEEKAASATMEKDYITRVQKQYEAYYEKAFNTQVAIVATLTIFISLVLWIASRFGFQTFDRRIEAALRETSAQLRTEFNQQLRTGLDTLRTENAHQVKQLEDNLKRRIAELEDGLTERIGQQERDLKARSEYQFQFAQGLNFLTQELWDGAITHFRHGLIIYNEGKQRGVIEPYAARRIASNMFFAMQKRDPAKFEEQARKELSNHLYKDLDDALAFAATEVKELAPLLTERK
jgi:hypothetical protein